MLRRIASWLRKVVGRKRMSACVPPFSFFLELGLVEFESGLRHNKRMTHLSMCHFFIKRETAHEVRGTSALRGPERSGDIRTSSPGLDSNKEKRISFRISFFLYDSARRDSNPRPSPWQGDTPPLSHSRIYVFVLSDVL